MDYQVIDPATGKEPDMEQVQKEEWAKGIKGFFLLGEKDSLLLVGNGGKSVWCPEGRFQVIRGHISLTEFLDEAMGITGFYPPIKGGHYLLVDHIAIIQGNIPIHFADRRIGKVHLAEDKKTISNILIKEDCLQKYDDRIEKIKDFYGKELCLDKEKIQYNYVVFGG